MGTIKEAVMGLHKLLMPELSDADGEAIAELMVVNWRPAVGRPLDPAASEILVLKIKKILAESLLRDLVQALAWELEHCPCAAGTSDEHLSGHQRSIAALDKYHTRQARFEEGARIEAEFLASEVNFSEPQ